LSLVAIVLVVEGTLLAGVYWKQSHDLQRTFAKETDALTASLRETLEVPLWDFDDDQIAKIGLAFSQNTVLQELRITDPRGQLLFQSPPEAPSRHPLLRRIEIEHNTIAVGNAELSFSMDGLQAELRWLHRTIVLVMGGSLLVIFGATGLLLRLLMRRPLEVLQQGIDRVAAGAYDHTFKEVRHVELAGIAQRFSEMAGRVESRETRLQQLNRELQAEVHERKRAEAQIRQSEAKSRALLDALPDLMFQIDRDGILLDFRGDRQSLDGAPDAFIGRPCAEVLPAALTDQLASRIASAIETRRIQVFEYESRDQERGTAFECRLAAAADGSLLALVRDITSLREAAAERSRLEGQLQRAHKMEAIGMLAGGVAHDLNNVLSGLVSYPELILMELPPDSPLRRPITTIQKSGQRAANIVQDLLTLARRGVPVSEVVRLNSVIREYLKSHEHQRLKLHHPDCRFTTNLEPRLLDIAGSALHLSKTVMNVVQNAVEAIPEGGGSVFITTENRYVDSPIRGYDRIEEGDYVVLIVSDTGQGIAADDLPRIFEPFYTRKVMGRSGTGLGMAVVWGTVKDHRGYVDVQSQPGKGTTVSIYLPASRLEPQPAPAPTLLADLRGRGEAILVVDDVEEQREIAGRMLEKLGYSVTCATSGEEALGHIRNRVFDLVLLDMIMEPGMDGLESYRRMLTVRPGQKALIASGFSESERVLEAERLGAGGYLKKPYLLEQLGAAVHSVLAG
jgi:signal transduction histidine kinase